MRDLIRRILKEQEFTKVRDNPNIYGCYLFKGAEREFCSKADEKIKLRGSKSNIKNQFREILGLGLSDNEIKEKLLQHKRKNPFFLLSRKNLSDFAKKIRRSCDVAENSIKNEIANLNNKVVVTFINNQKQTYHLINRLDTNSTALAYLLTIFRRGSSDKMSDEILSATKNYNDEVNKFYDKYFNVTRKEVDEGKFSVFFNQVFNYLGDEKKMDNSLKDAFEEAFYTIKKTRGLGLESEKEGFEYLAKKYPNNKIVSYAGDFDFVDMMGVDGVIKSISLEKWIPVQIKSKISNCYGNPKFCKNMCIGKNKEGNWVERFYLGETEINPFNLKSNIPPSYDYLASQGIKLK